MFRILITAATFD